MSSWFAVSGCDNENALLGHSKTKAEAKANGSKVVEYIPDKKDFNLLDGTKLHIDTAWTEISFTYNNGKHDIDSTYGYNFSVPYKQEESENFSFNFSLVDTTNQMFTNGMGKNLCQLRPKHLYDKMGVLLEQQDPDTSKGWTHTIITDTIIFTKIK